MPADVPQLGDVRSVTAEGLVEPVLQEPLEGVETVAFSGVRGITAVVKALVENVVMIAADETGIGECEEQIDHAAGIRPAIHVVADEEVLGGGIDSADLLQKGLERIEHAV